MFFQRYSEHIVKIIGLDELLASALLHVLSLT